MKKLFFIFIILLTGRPAMATVADDYKKLQKTPRYKHLYPLEIAIDRADFEAIEYFRYRAELPELQKASSFLQNKIAGIDEEIKDNHQNFVSGSEKVPLLTMVEDSRRRKGSFEQLLKVINRTIEDRELAAKAKEAKNDASVKS